MKRKLSQDSLEIPTNNKKRQQLSQISPPGESLFRSNSSSTNCKQTENVIYSNIFKYLNVKSLANACLVSSTWNKLIINNDGIWKRIYLRYLDDLGYDILNSELCQHHIPLGFTLDQQLRDHESVHRFFLRVKHGYKNLENTRVTRITKKNIHEMPVHAIKQLLQGAQSQSPDIEFSNLNQMLEDEVENGEVYWYQYRDQVTDQVFNVYSYYMDVYPSGSCFLDSEESPFAYIGEDGVFYNLLSDNYDDAELREALQEKWRFNASSSLA
jgi:hypothetical protein